MQRPVALENLCPLKRSGAQIVRFAHCKYFTLRISRCDFCKDFVVTGKNQKE